MYYYELSRELVKLGHKVSIISQAGDEIARRARQNGVRVYDAQDELPDEKEFDVICFSHYPMYDELLSKRYSNLSMLMVCHSEIIPLEVPIHHNSIKHYIGIRQAICDIIAKTGVVDEKITLIKNPVDFSRFNDSLKRDPEKKPAALFVGSLDYIRSNPFKHLYNMSKDQDFDVIHVGRNDYPDEINKKKMPGVKFYKPCWGVEKYLKDCNAVAGAFMGRTTIEGWCAGKTSLQYLVDKNGTITDVMKEDPPDDMSQFDSRLVAKKIESILKDIA